jgi:hypothetical protein
VEAHNKTEGIEAMNDDQLIDQTQNSDFPIGRYGSETPDLTIAQIVEQAPHPKEFYDHYHEDDLDDINDAWLGTAGGVYLFSYKAKPGWYMAVQSPDQGLIESELDRLSPREDEYRVIASWNGNDRLALLTKVWRRLAKISSQRTNHVARRSQWFSIADEQIKNDLPALIRSIS